MYLTFGIPGILSYKIANTLDSMIGHRTVRYRAFGWAAARFDDLLNIIPARLSGALLAIAAIFTRKGTAGRAFATMLRDAKKHHSPNAGWPEAAMAGALGLALAGPRDYAEERVEGPWIGAGTPLARAADIVRALRLYALACLLLAGIILGMWLAMHVTRPG